jgi:hypothetical protein
MHPVQQALTIALQRRCCIHVLRPGRGGLISAWLSVLGGEGQAGWVAFIRVRAASTMSLDGASASGAAVVAHQAELAVDVRGVRRCPRRLGGKRRTAS